MSIPYYTPASALRGEVAGENGLYEATIYRHNYAHRVVIIKETEKQVLVSSPTFFGWVRKDELIWDE